MVPPEKCRAKGADPAYQVTHWPENILANASHGRQSRESASRGRVTAAWRGRARQNWGLEAPWELNAEGRLSALWTTRLTVPQSPSRFAGRNGMNSVLRHRWRTALRFW